MIWITGELHVTTKNTTDDKMQCISHIPNKKIPSRKNSLTAGWSERPYPFTAFWTLWSMDHRCLRLPNQSVWLWVRYWKGNSMVHGFQYHPGHCAQDDGKWNYAAVFYYNTKDYSWTDIFLQSVFFQSHILFKKHFKKVASIGERTKVNISWIVRCPWNWYYR